MRTLIISCSILAAALGIAGFILFSKDASFAFSPNRAVPLDAITKTDETPPSALKNIATRDLADSVAQIIVSQNPNGPTPDPKNPTGSRIKAVDPKVVAGQLLEEQSKKIRDEIMNQQVPAPVAEPRSDASAVRAYFVSRAGAIAEGKRTLKNVSLDAGFTLDTLQALARANRTTLEAMVTIPTPAPLTFIQNEQVRLLMIQQAIYDRVIAKDADPLGATIAISLIEDVNTQFNALADTIETYVTDHHVVL